MDDEESEWTPDQKPTGSRKKIVIGDNGLIVAGLLSGSCLGGVPGLKEEGQALARSAQAHAATVLKAGCLVL